MEGGGGWAWGGRRLLKNGGMHGRGEGRLGKIRAQRSARLGSEAEATSSGVDFHHKNTQTNGFCCRLRSPVVMRRTDGAVCSSFARLGSNVLSRLGNKPKLNSLVGMKKKQERKKERKIGP